MSNPIVPSNDPLAKPRTSAESLSSSEQGSGLIRDRLGSVTGSAQTLQVPPVESTPAVRQWQDVVHFRGLFHETSAPAVSAQGVGGQIVLPHFPPCPVVAPLGGALSFLVGGSRLWCFLGRWRFLLLAGVLGAMA